MDKQAQQYLLNLVKRNYEDIATDFDVARKKQLWPEAAKLAELVKDGDSVLDVGCGNGRLMQALGGKRIEYLGVDSSEALVEAAIQNYQLSPAILRGNYQSNPKFQIPNSKFIVRDVLELDKLPEKDFDYIFCLAVLHHLPSDDLRIEALRQMKNKLKPGGKLVVAVWNLWSQAKFRRLLAKFALLKILGKNQMDFGDIIFSWKNSQGREISQRYYHAFTKKELRKIIQSVGLKMEKLYKDRYNYYAILGK